MFLAQKIPEASNQIFLFDFLSNFLSKSVAMAYLELSQTSMMEHFCEMLPKLSCLLKGNSRVC